VAQGFLIVILDTIEPGIDADYPTVARATCMGCTEWLWVTQKVALTLASGNVIPYCHTCATPLVNQPKAKLIAQLHHEDGYGQ
jgi:hypothetical protein